MRAVGGSLSASVLTGRAGVLQSTLGEAGLLHMFPLLAEIICDVPDSHKGTTAGGAPPASPAAFRRRQRAAY